MKRAILDVAAALGRLSLMAGLMIFIASPDIADHLYHWIAS